MSEIEAKVGPESEHAGWFPDPLTRATPKRARPLVPVLATVLVAAIAVVLGYAMWDAYMGAPWTRDGTVRAYVVTLAPEVAGRIVTLPVVDNEYVHKGDLLMVIDPTNYEIGVSQAAAAVQQAEASVQNTDAQIAVQQAQISANGAQVDRSRAARVFAEQQAGRYGRLAQDGWGTVQDAQQYKSQLQQQDAAVQTAFENLTLAQRQIASLKAQHLSAEASLAQAQAEFHQALVNLRRTRILSPVDGYVTNLLAQRGDYVNVGANAISVVDADSFWVDGYFEETNLAPIHVGDPAEIKLMGYERVLRGHVDSIAREINDANAQPNGQGIATVNPIFTWVRLAQRIPVRIHIDRIPSGLVLVAGMTATVQIDRPSAHQ
ncbi:MAG TPA: HlyD family secretion protein [Acetobacteraceae bacterium]|nr:HlyD family secretion protein [Acetobacteraceae bacterium]